MTLLWYTFLQKTLSCLIESGGGRREHKLFYVFLSWLCHALELGTLLVLHDCISHSFTEPWMPPLLFVSYLCTWKKSTVLHLREAVIFTFNLLCLNFISSFNLSLLFTIQSWGILTYIISSEVIPYTSTSFLNFFTFLILPHLIWYRGSALHTVIKVWA